MAIVKGGNASIDLIRDGWLNPEGDDALNSVYVSATSFKVDGDLTDVFTPGRGVKIDFITSGYKSCLVVSSSYNSGTDETTIVVEGDALVNEVIDELLVSASAPTASPYFASRVRATTSAVQLIPDITPTTILYPVETFDGLGEYDAGTSIFTALYKGIYRVSACMAYDPTAWAAGTTLQLRLYKNEGLYSVLDHDRTEYATSLLRSLGGTDLVELNAGDTISIKGYHSKGTSINKTASDYYNRLNIERVS